MDSYLKKIRIDKGYSIEQLSELTGISTKYLSSLEEGNETSTSLNIIEKLANAFNEDFVGIYYIVKYTIKNIEKN